MTYKCITSSLNWMMGTIIESVTIYFWKLIHSMIDRAFQIQIYHENESYIEVAQTHSHVPWNNTAYNKKITIQSECHKSAILYILHMYIQCDCIMIHFFSLSISNFCQ